MHFPCRCESNTSTLTDLIHREIESLQLGAASQEIRRNLLGGVLAHIEQLDLRKAQRNVKLPDTITEKRNRETSFHWSEKRRMFAKENTFKSAVSGRGASQEGRTPH